MTCPHRLWGEPDGLRCVEEGEHVTHTYESSTASALGEGGHRRSEGMEQ